MALVISPLKALMLDQQMRCKDAGVKAAVIRRREDMTLEDKQGIYDLQYAIRLLYAYTVSDIK